MPSSNNNMSKDGIKDVYRHLISEMENKGKPTEVLRKRLSQLIQRDSLERSNKLLTAKDLLGEVITEVEDFQDKYGISTSLYYTIKEFLSE